MKKKYDAIIIGGGIGGLAIGCLLSNFKKVLLLEKNNTFGGYCATFKRGKFKFEAAIHAINNCKKGNFAHNILTRCGVIKNIKLLKPPYLYRSIFPDYDLNVPQENEQKYMRVLAQYFPDEKTGLAKAFEAMRNIYKEVEVINRAKMLIKSPNLIAASKVSLKNLLDGFIKNDKLKAVISQYWMYCGLPPSKLSPIHFSYISEDYLQNGGYCVEGGMQNVVNLLADKIKKNGGDVFTKHSVAKILIENSKAIGVCANDNIFYGDHVVSNMDSRHTFKILSERNEKINTCLNQMELASPSISTIKVYLGLDVNLKELGINDYEIFLNDSYDLDASYDALLHNDISRGPFGICIHSNVDPTLCDKNKTVLSITMLAGYDYWASLGKEEYGSEKKRVGSVLVKRSEQVIPNLSKYVSTMIVATPLTMERYTGNAKGSAYGWTRNVHFYGSKHMNIQTPVNNLYLTSNWTKIGGGVEGVLRSADRTFDLIQDKYS